MPAVEPPAAEARIFLVGLMGAGKTTVGKILAKKLGCDYDAPGLASLSKEALHDQEWRQLRALLVAEGPFVAGVAASVADRPDDLMLMAAAGHVVYLRATPATLARRVGNGEGRPWLHGDPLSVLERMFAGRDEAYQSVGHVVDTDGRNPEDIATYLADRFAAR